MKCKVCGYEAPIIARNYTDDEFIVAIPAWWIDIRFKEIDADNVTTFTIMCPKCGAVQ